MGTCIVYKNVNQKVLFRAVAKGTQLVGAVYYRKKVQTTKYTGQNYESRMSYRRADRPTGGITGYRNGPKNLQFSFLCSDVPRHNIGCDND
jgi:hypothetical protein